MILRERNKIEFGWEFPPTKYVGNKNRTRRKLWISCDGCEKPILMGYTLYLSNQKRHGGKYLCHKCVANLPETKARLSADVKKVWLNPEFKAFHLNRISTMFKSEEHRKLVSDRNKKQYAENKEKYLKDKVSVMFTETAQANHKKAVNEPGYIENQRMKAIERFKDPQYKIRVAEGVGRFAESGKRSKPETVVEESLIIAKLQYKFQKTVGPYSFDFYLADYNVFIEVQGEYWHKLRAKERVDVTKASYLRTAFPGSTLIYIWEHETLIPGFILYKINSFLGVATKKDFEMHELSLRVIEEHDAKQFVRVWHYLGSKRNGSENVGLFLNGEIVGLCSFSRPVRKEVATSLGLLTRDVLEVDRFCLRPDIQKKNVATYFLSRALKLSKTECKMFVAFADTTFGHLGTIYKADNWELISETRPDYVYRNSVGWIMHKKTLYNHARSLRMTEAEYARENGFEKIVGNKKLKFVKRKAG